ncbi:MAG: amidohydrolase, partial [Peptostreptococcaceae bacterium]|nr:amidohydrolase [Peptostreptococcaceae bacterium]
MNRKKIDTILYNGTIYTLQKEGHTAEAVGIDQGRIVFVGSNKEAEYFDSENKIDLNGKTLLPGMGDSHLHMYAYCQNQTSVKLDDIKSIDELISTMKEKADITEKGKWIKGAGFDQTKFTENRLPTRWDLDKISTEHPVVIRRSCLHVMIANSLAIEIAGIDDEKVKASGGLIEVDENGQLTGIFREKSTIIFDDIVPDPLADPEEKKKIMCEVLNDMVSKGITSINTYAAKIWNYDEDLGTYRDLEKQGLLPIRVIVSLDTLFEPETRDRTNLTKDVYNKVKYGSFKLFTDGSLGARSAALIEPYSDDPDNRGILVEKKDLIRDLKEAYELGLQPAIHAIGDRALEMTLDAIEYVIENAEVDSKSKDNKEKRLPFRIIHAQVVNKHQLGRMKKLPVVLDIQPIFLTTDLYWIESRLGKERVKTSYLWKTMMDAGMMMAGGSDCPVESYEPLKGIYAAVTRQDFKGYPEGGWEPDEKLSVYEAVCLFTKNIAYTTGDQDVLGTIDINKYADMVLLDSNPFEIEAEKIK